MSPTWVNLVEDHGFISEEYYLHWYEAFWGSPKQSHEAQSGQCHTIVESRVRLTKYASFLFLVITYFSNGFGLNCLKSSSFSVILLFSYLMLKSVILSFFNYRHTV